MAMHFVRAGIAVVFMVATVYADGTADGRKAQKNTG